MTDKDDASKELPNPVDPFALTLHRHGIELKRSRTTILQVNVGLLCDLACKHCHLEAGPHRKELMDLRTMEEVAAFAKLGQFDAVDITGGAPELNADILAFVELLAPIKRTLMFQSNLTVLDGQPAPGASGILPSSSSRNCRLSALFEHCAVGSSAGRRCAGKEPRGVEKT